jgi:hypothetical protein
MSNADITDPIFLKAVEAVDSGNLEVLQELISGNPRLLTERLPTNEKGYFKDPYLLWFVADNPIRIPALPLNIIEVTRLLVDGLLKTSSDSIQHQLDYTLGLVATGRIPRECGVQIALMDLLIDAGAKPGGGMGAFANSNIEAANHLINRGGILTLPAAICLERMDDVERLLPIASSDQKLTALTAAAFLGQADMVKLLLGHGIQPNGYPDSNSGFHSHATPLHQAVSSGSLETVELLVEAGASLNAPDKIYNGTPLGWAKHMQAEPIFNKESKHKYALIAAYLKSI